MKKLLSNLLLLFALLLFGQNASAQIVNIPDATFKAYLVGSSVINTNLDTEIQLSEAIAFSGAISISSMGVADLTGIEAFSSLTVLNISQNPISSVDLSANTALTSVSVMFTPIACLDLSYNTSLTYLEGSSSSLQQLNMKNGNNTNVTYFNTSGSSSLSCIQVDNASYSNTNWLNHDAGSVFSIDCGQPIAGFTSDAPVCFGTAVNFTNTSLSSDSYSWDFGDASGSTTANPAHIYPAAGDYFAVLSSYNCYGTDTASATITQGKHIYGNITYSGGPVSSGWALIYPYESFYTTLDTIQIQPLDAGGFYQFNNIIEGDYIVKIFPDTLAFPTLSPTYFGDVWAWDSSTVITQACSNDFNADVSMLEDGALGGVGLLQGHVIEGPGFGRAPGDPVHGVDVKLGVTASNTIAASTETDLNGMFSFGGVPFGTYTIYVDIPGLERDSSYIVTVDASTNQFTDLDYLVDSVSIYIVPGIGIQDITNDPALFNVYPNPVAEQSSIFYSLSNGSNVTLDVYNVLGTKVKRLMNAYQTDGEHIYIFDPKTHGLKSGIYFITLSAGNKISTIKILVIEK